MRVLMTGGGTGGHVNPALAIADTIRKYDPTAQIAYVGTRRGIESKLVPAAGYPLYFVEIQGMKRSLSLSNLKTAWLTLTSPHKAKKLIREFAPDLVVGTGGYVNWPVVRAAARMGIPCALHESNAAPGVAVRMLASEVDRIYLNFEETGAALGGGDKLLRVGNPVLHPSEQTDRASARRTLGIPDRYKYCILSYGGSMGAERLNYAVLRLMRDFTSKHPEVFHLHASGAIERELCGQWFRELGLDRCENIRLVEYIYDMPLQMAAADLVICRAGAMTVSEVALNGKCTIFIPSPNVTNNHQVRNASVLADAGAAVLFEEKDLEGVDAAPLTEQAAYLLSDAGASARHAMERAIRAFAVPDANDRIYRDLMELVAKKNAAREGKEK